MELPSTSCLLRCHWFEFRADRDPDRNGLLLPLEEGQYNEQDVAIGRSYAQGLALGIAASDMAFYAVAAKQIVDEEMRLRARFTAHLPEDQDAGLTQRLVQSARATRNYVIDRTFQRRLPRPAI